MSTAVVTSVVQCEHCGKKNRVPATGQGRPQCGNCHQPLAWIVDADDDTFGEVAEAAPLPVLVDMWAVWCGPCRMVSPALERVAHDLAGQVKLVKVDIDRSPRLAQRFTIQAVPTLMLLRNGEVIAREAGAAPAEAIREWVEKSLSNAGAQR
ncbi:MAG: trxA [Frankiales bacterium]|nr:trxA [Frankiales bacterium]